jgi:hypothetical protein
VPGIITNTLTLGASYDLNEKVTVSLAWMHGCSPAHRASGAVNPEADRRS